MSILALDLGTNCGFALLHPTGVEVSGTWDLSVNKKRMESPGMRFVRFREHLDAMSRNNGVHQVYFEEVRRHAGTTAAHVYGGLLAIMMSWCAENDIEFQGMTEGTVTNIVQQDRNKNGTFFFDRNFMTFPADHGNSL